MAFDSACSFDRVAPVLPVRDVTKALERYRRLGFTARSYEGTSEQAPAAPFYGFLSRDGVQLHLSRVDDLDPKSSMVSCYLYVADVDAVHAAWSAAKVEGRLTPPRDTPYGLREMGYVDPDGNLLRIGSPLRQA
jgi:uncharacterized glyoxalase superfamily protein PhnB